MDTSGTTVVKVDAEFVETMGRIARGEDIAAPVASEVGVRRTSKYLPCILTAAEVASVYAEIGVMLGEASAADRRVETIKERAKADVQFATNAAKELREALDAKGRITREGKVDRDVPVTVRIDWIARTRTTTRDDTGEVLSVEAATPHEVEECGVWSKDMAAGKAYLKAPDGAVLKQRDLSDNERQGTLPLPDGGKVESPPVAGRAWLPATVWDGIEAETHDRLTRPDPKGPHIDWRADGAWVFCDVPAGLRPQLDHHATQAGLSLVYGDTTPTLADLAAQSKEPPSKRRKPKAS